MTTDTVHILKTAEAVALIKKAPKGALFSTLVRVDLPIVGEEGYSFPGLTVVKLTRQDAIKFVTDTLKHFEERGARIKISHHISEMVVGDNLHHFYLG